MNCHVLSCAGHDRLSAGLANAPSVGVLHAVPPSRSVPFTPLAACPRRGPCFARIACACARHSRRRAFRAPDCAGDSQAQDACLLSVPLGIFAPARSGRRSGLRTPLPPDLSYHRFHGTKPLSGIISKFVNELPSPPPATSSSARTGPASGPSSPLRAGGGGCAPFRDPTRPASAPPLRLRRPAIAAA